MWNGLQDAKRVVRKRLLRGNRSPLRDYEAVSKRPASVEQDIVKGRFLGTELGALEYVVRSINNGIRDLPIIPFTEGLELSEIPQSEEDKIFAREDLEMGCRNGIYEEMSHREAQEKKVEGKMVSSAFVVWQGEGEERKGRFVINFHKQSQHWSRGSVRMETLPSFAVELQQNDTLLSLDIKSGYRHFYLHPTCGIILYSVTRGATIAA